MSNEEYRKFEVDNAVCNRRFHLGFDPQEQKAPYVKIVCPHCQITLFEATSHPPVELMREENLVNQTDRSRLTVYKCDFLKQQ